MSALCRCGHGILNHFEAGCTVCDNEGKACDDFEQAELASLRTTIAEQKKRIEEEVEVKLKLRAMIEMWKARQE